MKTSCMLPWSNWWRWKDAQIKYSTVQNWYPGDENGKGGIYNFVTKRGDCRGANSKISWTQVETGSAITWKYPSCILRGENSVGEFYSVAVANNRQQADTGTKMIHIGRNTRKHDRLEGDFRRARAECLSRAGTGHAAGGERAQPYAVRLPAHRQRVRRPHLSRTSKAATRRRGSNTRRRRRRFPPINCSTAASAAFPKRTP
jgi:hypothetical protein